MAHNTLTIAGNEPNSQSQFPTIPLAQPFLLLTGAGGTSAYSNSGATSMTAFRFYSPTSTTSNTIGATLTRVGSGNTDWVSSFTLPSGKTYVMQMSQNVVFSATGYYAFQFVVGGSAVGPYAYVGSGAPASYESSGFCTRVITTTTTTTISFSSPASSNVDTVANQGTVPSEYSFLLVRQLT